LPSYPRVVTIGAILVLGCGGSTDEDATLDRTTDASYAGGYDVMPDGLPADAFYAADTADTKPIDLPTIPDASSDGLPADVFYEDTTPASDSGADETADEGPPEVNP